MTILRGKIPIALLLTIIQGLAFLISVAPVEKFVNYAKEHFSNVKNHFLQGRLPNLDFPPSMQHSFDSVLLIAVWMHIPKEFYKELINKIKSLLKPNGKVILIYSTTPRKENSKRLFENIDSLELKELFNQNEFSQIDVVVNNNCKMMERG